MDEENDKQTEVNDLLEKTADVDRKSKLHTSLVSLSFAPRNISFHSFISFLLI